MNHLKIGALLLLALTLFVVANRVQAQTIKKCVAGSKVIYTNVDCPDYAKANNVDILDSTVSGMSATEKNAVKRRIQAEKEFQDAARRPVVASLDSGKKKDCNVTAQQIAQLDAEARQPISGQRQDWIRIERNRLIDFQNSIRC